MKSRDVNASSPAKELRKRIDMLRAPFTNAYQALCRQFPNQPCISDDPLYALPAELLRSIETYLPRWLSRRELEFECALSDFCGRHGSIGIYGDNPLVYQPLQPIVMPALSRADFDALGWTEFVTYEGAIESIRLGGSRLEPLYDQARAYLGWLITNPQFLKDVEGLGHQALTSMEGHEDYERFLQTWQLTALVTRDLPLPQLPDLAGIELPVHLRRKQPQMRIGIPVTMRLPVRYDLGKLVDEIRNSESPSHLAEWQQVLNRADGSKHGLQRYRHLFRLYFYRNVVLASRYRSKFQDNIERLDVAFGSFLNGLSEDSIKKLRLFAQRRLKHFGD